MKQFSALTAIREHCRECVCGSYKEVALCQVRDCPLYLFRFGVKPGARAFRQKIMLARRKWPKESRDAGLK